MSNAPKNAQAIFLEAVTNTPAERWSEYLDEACGDDRTLRAEVQRLLDTHGAMGSFMDKPAAAAAPTVDQSNFERPGTQVGPYKLLEKIGEGGMGVVYMAEQTQPVRRNVALKIIKPGMDTHEVVARFEAERQALALMDHPNIAQVFDAGATDAGRPYFVMELVHGTPITEYCDQQSSRRASGWSCSSLCHGVQHAHQKGVIHRDIKPCNLLVTCMTRYRCPRSLTLAWPKPWAHN